MTGPDRSRRAVMGLAALAGALWLSGCASVPTSSAVPDLVVPPAWQQAAAAPDAAPSSPPSSPQVAAPTTSAWWRSLGDAGLTAVIEQALARNNNLAQAAVRVRRAQLVAGQAASDGLPEVAVRGNASTSEALSSGARSSRSFGTTASVSWELDLWGRLAAARDAADLEAQATQADRDAAALSLSATVARLYWQLGYLNQRVAVSQQSIDYARETLRLVRAQYDAGAASGLELAQATQSLANQQAAHTQWLQQRVEALNALALLLDGPPGSVARDEQRTLPEAALPALQAGVPAAVLTRRPDVQASELRLRKTLATVAATQRSFYPALTLTGSVGTSSSALSEALRNPVGTLGVGLVLPFIQWRDMQRNVAISQTDHELAVLAYRQAWYQALAEVEDALSAERQLTTQGEQLAVAAQAARQSERLSEARYRAGAVPLKTWLDAQESRRQVDINLALNRLNLLQNRATLMQALGGGV